MSLNLKITETRSSIEPVLLLSGNRFIGNNYYCRHEVLGLKDYCLGEPAYFGHYFGRRPYFTRWATMQPHYDDEMLTVDPPLKHPFTPDLPKLAVSPELHSKKSVSPDFLGTRKPDLLPLTSDLTKFYLMK